MSTQSPVKRRKINVFEEFRVVLGKPYSGQNTVHVAKAYLTKSSDYLKRACGKEWKEGQTKTIELQDITPDTFAIYLQWLQTGEVVLTERNTINLTYRKPYSPALTTSHSPLIPPPTTETHQQQDMAAETILGTDLDG